MFAKKATLLIALMAILMLTACTGGPERAAREFIEASMTGDGATALNLTCDQYKEQVQMVGFLTAGIGMLAGIDPQNAEADLSELNLETISEDGNTATVHVSGEIVLGLLGAAMPQVIDTDILMVKEDGDWRFCGDVNTSLVDSQVELDLDIEATITAGIAATQAALPEEEFDEVLPTVTEEPTEEPTPEQVETPVQPEPTESVATPTASATRADTNPPLLLPFVDNFDEGLRPEWRIINGRPLVSNGRLTSAVDELSLEIGNTTLADYTLTLNISGDDSCSTRGRNAVLGFSPSLRMTYSSGFSGRLIWWTLNDDEWSQIDEQDRLDCGRFEIAVFGNSYQVRLNGTLVSELVFEPASGPLFLGIDEEVYIDDLEIR